MNRKLSLSKTTRPVSKAVTGYTAHWKAAAELTVSSSRLATARTGSLIFRKASRGSTCPDSARQRGGQIGGRGAGRRRPCLRLWQLRQPDCGQHDRRAVQQRLAADVWPGVPTQVDRKLHRRLRAGQPRAGSYGDGRCRAGGRNTAHPCGVFRRATYPNSGPQDHTR